MSAQQSNIMNITPSVFAPIASACNSEETSSDCSEVELILEQQVDRKFLQLDDGEVLPSKKNRNQEQLWPELSKVSEKPQRPVRERPVRPVRERQSTYTVANSRISQLKTENRRQNFRKSDPNDPKTIAFAKLSDKHGMASRLKGTKPCSYVCRHGESFGVCTRMVCDFAHSQEELKYAPCVFGSICNRMNLPLLDKSRQCRFLHEGKETIEQYHVRTGIAKPNLPLTSELSRKPITQFVPVTTAVDPRVRKLQRFKSLSWETETPKTESPKTEQVQTAPKKTLITVTADKFSAVLCMIEASGKSDDFEIQVV
jgi:hypothetical protein